MRFLVVAPQFVEKPGQYYSFPIGLAYIASALKSKKFDVECLNLNHYEDDKILAKVIRDREIDVVCTGTISSLYPKAERVFTVAREAKPNILTIAGGGMVSAQPELMLDLLGLSFGVVGEGEHTIVELAQSLCHGEDLSLVNGLVYRDRAGQVVRTAEREVIKDLDSIVWPDYASFDIERYVNQILPSDFMYSYVCDEPRELPMVASRSCPYECTFCYLPLGRTYRERSLDDFFAELDHMVKNFKLNTLTVYDDLFAVKRDRLTEFCARIKQYNLHWVPQLRVNLVDPEILKMMKDAGCYYISYGIESASPTILKTMKKKITVPMLEKALAETKDAEIGFQGNFLFGDTYETRETVKETLDWWVQHLQYQILLWPVGTYPGAELYHDAVKNGKIPDEKAFVKAGCPLLNVSKLTDHEFGQMLITLREHYAKYRIYPKMLGLEKTGTASADRDLYRVKFECPHCNQVQEYKNFSLREFDSTLTGCRNCQGRFWFPSVKAGARRYISWSFLTSRLKQVGPLRFVQIAARKSLSWLRSRFSNSETLVPIEVTDAALPHFTRKRVGLPPSPAAEAEAAPETASVGAHEE